MRNGPAGDRRFPSFRLSNYTEGIKGGWTDNEIERFVLRAVPHPGEFNERTGDTSEWEPRPS